MAETLYGALGVAVDADTATIQAAYRDHVKRFHPDVTDDPDATRTFKRLTTARDVLTDDRERALYDRLGHDTYVRRHIGSDLWEPTPRSDTFAPDGSRSATAGDIGRFRTPTTAHRRADWGGTDWDGTQNTRRGNGAKTAHDGGGWQMASEAYRRSPRTPNPGRPSRLSGLHHALRTLGPWVGVHLAFIGSAAATGWFTLAQTDRVFAFTPPVLVAGLLMAIFVLSLSSLHVISVLYS